MTEEELKVKFDYIQGIFNRCINYACQILIDSIIVKVRYLNGEQADELERQEYIHAVNELAQLYIRYSALNDIQNFYSVPDFFWESGFYEALKPDEKRKYLSFSPLSFNYSQYAQDNTVYDEELPYFSMTVKAVVLERYSAYLRKKKEPTRSRRASFRKSSSIWKSSSVSPGKPTIKVERRVRSGQISRHCLMRAS